MTNPYIFDLAFVAILLAMFTYGKRRGAFRVVAGLFGTIAAWLGAAALSPTVTPITVRLITPYASGAVASAAESMGLTPILDTAVSVGQGVSAAAGSLSSLADKLGSLGLPEQLSDLAQNLGISGTLDKLLPTASGSVTPYDLLTQAMVGKLSPIITFFLLFIAIKIALSIVVRLLSIDWPIIGAVNRLAGGLIGLVGGLFIVLALCAGIFTFGSSEPEGLTSSVMLSQSMTGGLLSSFMQK